MSTIYTPTGMAKEYSPYACNLYIGCTHCCKYCYAPHTLQRSPDNHFGYPSPRKDVLRLLEKDLKSKIFNRQILLSFIGDVYCNNTDQSATTRSALQLLNAYNASVAVPSKGGARMLKDVDVFVEFGERITVGTTLTFFDEKKSREWEIGALLPQERLAVLRELHSRGIKTFASFEPVIEPEESLKLIEKTLKDGSVLHYKIGKINNYKGIDKGVDWTSFLERALLLLRSANKQIYVKKCLAEVAPSVELREDEIDPERYITRTEIEESGQMALV
jgi:DNA repair photolyase